MNDLLLSSLIATAVGEKSLLLFVEGQVMVLKGKWEWEFSSDIVFCSDVILSDYHWLEGTKAIIHPEDIPHLKQHLRFLKQTGTSTFRFRVITTYGEMKMLKGENVVFHQPESNIQLQVSDEILQMAAAARTFHKDIDQMKLLKKSSQLAEQVTNTGTWFINTSSNEIYYSDEMYRIYGLPPQSLNHHLNTFLSYIHDEDATAVSENFDRAYKAHLPLHLEFRIRTAQGKDKIVKQITQWRFNEKGEQVLYGLTKDITEEKNTEYSLEKTNAQLEFSRQLEKFHDQVTNTGHWMVELLTRNTVYSDNYYRLFGIRPQMIQGKMIRFLDCVHHEDRDMFEEALRAMHYEHRPPNLQFRIVRTDGRVRLIKQSAKIEIFGESEMVMIGIMEDITQQQQLEIRARELDETTAVQHFAYDRAEEVTKTGTLTIDLQTNLCTWSANLFRLLGYKPHLVEPTTNQILKYIHPNDRKRFNDEIELAMNNNGGNEFMIHFYRMGELRYFQASFKLTAFGSKRFIIGTLRDITDTREQEMVTAEKVQLVDLLTDNILDRVMITDESNNIIFWNRQCENVFSLKSEQVLRKNLFEILPVLKHETVLNDFKEALKGKPVHQYQVSDLATKKYVDLHMLPLKNTHNEVSGILHVIHDVTQEYELKQNLTERLNFIENILETTVDRIKVFDRHLNFIYWNSRSEAHYGLKKQDVIGKNILQVFPGLQNKSFYYHFKRALRGETVYISPEETTAEGGHDQTYLIPIKNKDNEVSSVLWITHDFSKEYKLLEDQKKAFNILDNIEEACYELDAGGKILFVNRKTEMLWNKTREELLNQNIWQVFPETVDSALYFAITHAIESKELVQREIISPILNRKVFINITPTAQGVIVAYVDLHRHDTTEK